MSLPGASGGAGFEPEYFERLAGLEAGHFWFRGRNALILWMLRKHFPGMRDYLEVGCGTGFVLSAIAEAFPDARITGSEYFDEGLRFARTRVPRATLRRLDARELPYEAAFDVVGAFDVIEHIDEDERVLAAIAQALRPGGGLVLTVPQHPWLWSASDELARHVRRYTRVDLHDKLSRAGLRILRSTSFVSLLLPAMAAFRRRNAPASRIQPGDDLRIAPALNRLLEAVLRIEIGLIRLGLDFPAGGSRLVVAMRTA